jgi:hypothetical protein
MVHAERQHFRNGLEAEDNKIEVEHRTNGEVIIPRFDVLTIGGPSGLHKSTVARMLAGVDFDERNAEAQNKFHLDGVPVPFQVGQLIRADIEARTGKPFIQDFNVPEEEDRRIDEGTRNLIENIRKPLLTVTNEGIKAQLRDAAVIIEARYGHFIAADVDEQMSGKKYAPRTERILIYSSDEEERLATEVEREKAGSSSLLSKADLEKLGIAREIELSRKAQLLFPEIVNEQYIYDKLMKTREGNNVFTVAVDAKGKKPPELTAEVYKQLYKRGALVVVTLENFADTAEGKSAFALIKDLNRCQGLLEGNPCNRYGIRTLDVYSEDELLVQIAACSNDHARNIQQRLLKEADEVFHFSRNGIPVQQISEITRKNKNYSGGEIFNPEEIEASDTAETNGENKPIISTEEDSQLRSKPQTRNGKSFGEPVSSRRNFPKKHPNPKHPSNKTPKKQGPNNSAA